MKELLYEFLVKEGALFNYLELVPSIEYVCEKYKPNRLLTCFLWKHTKQGTLYWMQISENWDKTYKYRNGTNL